MPKTYLPSPDPKRVASMPRLPHPLLLLLLVVTACGRASDPSAGSMQVVDGLGRTVILATPPARVVSIAPGATEIVLIAGAERTLVGVTTADDDSVDLPRISALPLDTEAVLALQPDLIVASEQVNDPAHADLFDALGIPILYLESGTWDGVLHSIEQVGDVLGTPVAAGRAVDSLVVRQRSLQEHTSNLTDRPTAIFLVSQETSWSFGRGSFVIDLMEWAGLDPLMKEFDAPAPVLDDEWVLMRNPDVILGAFAEDFSIGQLLEHHPTWASLDAVRYQRVYRIHYSLILTPGPQNVEAAWEMARVVHPEVIQP